LLIAVNNYLDEVSLRFTQVYLSALQGERRLLEESGQALQLESKALGDHQLIPKSSSKRGRAGQRNPKRDAVGMNHYDS